VATFTQLASGNWRVQVRRKTRYVVETFRRRKDGEEWALEMERNIDRNGSSKPRVLRNVRTFGDLIDLHDEDMHEAGRRPRRSKAAVMESLKTELGSVKLPAATTLVVAWRTAADRHSVWAIRIGNLHATLAPAFLDAGRDRVELMLAGCSTFHIGSADG
jgi:hypothetical protein